MKKWQTCTNYSECDKISFKNFSVQYTCTGNNDACNINTNNNTCNKYNEKLFNKNYVDEKLIFIIQY